jgi:uncharacterized membrane protein YdbT with pleckstrin-like domain
MLSQVQDFIEDDEKLIETTHPSLFDTNYSKGFISGIGLILLLITLLVGKALGFAESIPYQIILAAFVAPSYLLSSVVTRRMFVIYHFTDRKIVEEDGILNKEYRSINYDDIDNVKLEEELEERIFDVGDVYVDTAGRDKTEIILEGLRDPERYQSEIAERANSANQNEFQDSQTQDFETQFDSEQEEIDQDVLENERERVNQRILELNQKMNNHRLSQSEANQWYKLKGQKELLNRLIE